MCLSVQTLVRAISAVRECTGRDVQVHSPHNKRFEISMPWPPNTDIKKIENLEGIPVDHQRLVYAGQQLDDSGTLEDYNIGSKTTVLVLKS